MFEIVSRLADDVSGSKARAAARVQGAQACTVLYDQILHSVMFPPQPTPATASPALPAAAAAETTPPPTVNEDELIAAQRDYASRLQVIDHGRRGLAAGAWPLVATPEPAQAPGSALTTRGTADEEPLILPWEQLLARMALQQRLGG